MEYARRRKRRRRKSSSAGRALGALVMVGLIIYLFTASAAGKWLAEEVMAPAFSALSELPVFNSDGLDKLEQESSTNEESLEVSLNGGISSVSENVELPAISCFALQMGVFSSEENASALSESLKERGAGGYVYDDEGMYRVLAAGYNTETEARTVKERLISEGSDCAVYDISAPAVTFSITAGKNEIQSIKESFYALYDAQTALCAACIEFDEKSVSPSEGAALVSDIQSKLASSCEELYKYADASPALAALAECCDKCTASLGALAEGSYSGSTEFSSAMKHSMLEISDAYASMLRSIGQ